MSKEIMDHFLNKDVRTEVRIEQRESRPWPAITICSQAAMLRHFSCYGNVNVTPHVPTGFCSKEVKLLDVVEETLNKPFDVKQNCMVYNQNGTLRHNGGLKRGLNFKIEDRNTHLKSIGLVGIVVFFSDADITKNSSQAFYAQDFDFHYGIMNPGGYEFLLEITEIEKLGRPYQSVCTKQKSINDKYQSRYTYEGCMDRCLAQKVKEKCGRVTHLFQDFVTEEKAIYDRNKTIDCFSKEAVVYERNSSYLASCECKQPCRQRIYKVSTKQVDWNMTDWHLKIRFKSKMVSVITEHPLYSVEDLISQVGGSCGLFVGMSLLSVVEIIFHGLISIAEWCL